MGHPVTFYYLKGPKGDHITHAVELLMVSINTTNRYQENELLQDDAYGTFESLLEDAAAGKLEWPEQVKPINWKTSFNTFEMRWTSISVIDIDPVSGMYSDPYETHVRLYYVETGEQWVVGVHAHEKLLTGTGQDIGKAQDSEIQIADRNAAQFRFNAWVVPELAGRSF